jgi:molybdopterin converting factor small subunit
MPMLEPTTGIKIRVELFGLPRLRSGRREVELLLPTEVSRQEVVRALAEACPALVGQALRADLSDLQDGYLFNHNGTTFLSGDRLSFQAGDALLLLSNQAGG